MPFAWRIITSSLGCSSRPGAGCHTAICCHDAREECQRKHRSQFTAASDLEAPGWEGKGRGSHGFLFSPRWEHSLWEQSLWHALCSAPAPEGTRVLPGCVTPPAISPFPALVRGARGPRHPQPLLWSPRSCQRCGCSEAPHHTSSCLPLVSVPNGKNASLGPPLCAHVPTLRRMCWDAAREDGR